MLAFAAYSAFIVLLFLGSRFLPGIHVEGQPLRDGARLPYKLSGMLLFIVVSALAAAAELLGFRLARVLDHFWSLFWSANVWALLITAYLMARGWRRNPPAGLWDRLKSIWLGAELNPRLASVDLKMFMYHPSLIGLHVVNLAFASQQLERYGTITAEMFLYQCFTSAYLFTHYVREDFMLSTWDIIAERFGFMLVWGDLVYVTFYYSIVGWWVVDRGWTGSGDAAVHEPLSTAALVALVVLHLLSHVLFRGSNWQKDRFKRNPSAPIWGKPPELVGGRLLASGWWGIGRKLNYTGEIGVYITFALCAGLSSWIPYVLPFSLVLLLAQRAWRDEQRCKKKYGELWDAYCARARFRMVPFLY
ncbi:MAG: hypothetical protein AAF938_26995 [Myxococcota bacterium]